MAVGTIKAFWAGLYEVLLLRDAERIAKAHGERQVVVEREARAARAYLRTARRVSSPDVALSMLDLALPRALASAHASRGATDPFDAHRELERLVADHVAPSGVVVSLAAREEAEGRRFAEREALRDEIDHAVAAILGNIETRSVFAIRALRWCRVAAVALAVLLCANHVVRATFLVHDVALHKPVTSSPLKVQIDPDGAVDGRTRGTFGIHTEGNQHAFVMVDLERTYDVREVRIYNRGDGWFDDILPLTLSISTDGRTFEDVATRTTHFDMWSEPLGGRPARFVRVSNGTYIALNEIEVYARE